MTVEKLIEILQEQDPNALVLVCTPQDRLLDTIEVYPSNGGVSVIIDAGC